jgi:hypothetical protein
MASFGIGRPPGGQGQAWPSSPLVEDPAEQVFRASDRVDKARSWTVQLLALFPAALLVRSALGDLWQWLVRAWTGKPATVTGDPGPIWVRLLWLLAVYAAVVAVFSLIRRPVPRRWPWLGSSAPPGRVESVSWRMRGNKLLARSGLIIQLVGLAVLATAAGPSRWPGGLLLVAPAAGLLMAPVALPPWRRRRLPPAARRNRNWRVQLGPRRPYAPVTIGAGEATKIRQVAWLPATVDLRLLWAGVGMFTAVAVLMVFLAARIPGTNSAYYTLGGVGLLLGFAADELARLGRRVELPTATTAMRDDARPPVLLLRAFAEDQARVRAAVSAQRSLLAKLSPRRSIRFEEALARRLAWRGPVVAVDAPGTTLPPLGAAREATGVDSWTALVADWMLRANTIVIVAAPRRPTAGLAWELEVVTRLGLWPKTVLVLPPARRPEIRARWDQFARLLEPVRPGASRLATDPAVVLAALVTGDGVVSLTAAERSEWSYAAALDRALASLQRTATLDGGVAVTRAAETLPPTPLPAPPRLPEGAERASPPPVYAREVAKTRATFAAVLGFISLFLSILPPVGGPLSVYAFYLAWRAVNDPLTKPLGLVMAIAGMGMGLLGAGISGLLLIGVSRWLLLS